MALTVGDVLPFAVTITDPVTGVPVDATTVTLTVTLPDGTPAVGSPFTVASSPTGQYDRNLVATMAGRYLGKWLATGLNAGSHSQVFYVRTADDPALLGLDEIKEHLNIPLTTITHDQELERIVGTSTEVVEHFVGPLVRRTYIDDVSGGSDRFRLRRHPVSITTITPIATGATAVTIGDLDLAPDGWVRQVNGQAISWGPLRVEYVAGLTEVPDKYIKAALIIIKHLWETQRGPGRPSVLGQSSMQGGETTFLPVLGFAIPNRAMDLLKLRPSAIGIA